MNVGILVSGGLCPGLNTLIKSISINEIKNGNNVSGYKQGFKGLNYEDKLNINENTHMLSNEGGCILQTSRVRLNVFQASRSMSQLHKLYCIGGNGTLSATKFLSKTYPYTNIIGCPKTIDNDILNIESFGHSSSVDETLRFLETAYTEAHSMPCIMFVETMGRNSGFLAAATSLAGSDLVDLCIIPESNKNTEDYVRHLMNYENCVVVVSEAFNYSKLLEQLRSNKKVCKIMKPGYSVRSIKPNSYDLLSCNELGFNAVKNSQKSKNFIQTLDNEITYLSDFEEGEKRMINDNPLYSSLENLNLLIN